MAISVASSSIASGLGTSGTIGKPTGTTNGDLLVLFVKHNTNCFHDPCKCPNCSPLWTSLYGSNCVDLDVQWRKACCEPCCYTIGFGAAADEWAAVLVRLTCATVIAGGMHASTGATGSSATPDPDAISSCPPAGNYMAFGFFGERSLFICYDVACITAPACFTITNNAARTASTEAVMSVAQRSITNPGNLNPGTFTHPGGAETWSAGTILIAECAGPAITCLCPTSGPKGTTVVITGTNLACVDQVRFGGKIAAWSLCPCCCNKINATAPNQGNGLVDVFVRAGGTENADDCNNNFTYTGGNDDNSPGGGSRGAGSGNNPGKGTGSGGASGGGNNNPELFVASKPGTTDTKAANISFSGNNAQQIAIRPFDAAFGIRIIGINTSFHGTTANGIEYYFGTGTDISTNAGKEVSEIRNRACNPTLFARWWPVGAGPKGGKGEPLSVKGTADVNEVISATIFYQEEPYWD